ncbi:MAG: porin family protein [Leptolyngbya sp. SIO1D8]|nr:porin family protein [Leptolyngbya sp. SIO1D8]
MQLAFASALGGAIAGVSVLMSAKPANAQAAYGSYVGVGAAFGLTSDADTGDGSDLSAVIAGRYRFLRVPISIRAQAFIFGDGFAFVPTVSYDYPLNWNTDIYLGAGLSFASGDNPSPVGDRTAFVLQPGVDYMFPSSRLTLFGNAIIAFNGYRDGGNTAVSLQGGVGYQF